MGALATFDFEAKPLRLIDRNGESWFVATDAAGILGYAAAKDLTRTLDDDEKGGTGAHPWRRAGSHHHQRGGPVPGHPPAPGDEFRPGRDPAGHHRFQRWVFHDVLPSLRRTGTYAPAEPSDAPGVATAFRSYFSIGELIGLDRNQAALAANRATRNHHRHRSAGADGRDPSPGAAAGPASHPDRLGKQLGGLSAIAVNNMLADRGFQEGRRDAKDRPYWVPTAAGERFAVFLDTGKKHSDGTPVRQLKWSADIVAALRETAEVKSVQNSSSQLDIIEHIKP